MKTLLSLLTQHAIPYELVTHPALYHMEEGLSLPHPEAVGKNLFLKERKGRRYFLVTLPRNAKADFQRLRELFSSDPLTMASPEELKEILGLGLGCAPLWIVKGPDLPSGMGAGRPASGEVNRSTPQPQHRHGLFSRRRPVLAAKNHGLPVPLAGRQKPWMKNPCIFGHPIV